MNLTASGMAAMLSCLLLFSCNDEDFLERNGDIAGNACDNICFGISPDGNVQTRGNVVSDVDGYTSGQFVLRSQDSADTLCVRAIVSDGVHSSAFGDRQAVTRGTPVTEDNFYDSFHVLAYWKKGGTQVEEQFYMDTNVAKAGDGLWSSTDTYYWPGAGHALQFYAWAPAADAFSTTPQSPATSTLAYTVPTEAVDQKDIVVARPDETPGDHNAAQELTFDHVCTAVRFVIGSQMQAGRIESVALKGVQYKGAYDLKSGSWELKNDVTDFTQSLGKEMTGEETDGTSVTASDGTFMMLPQTLPDNAKVEVVFHSTATNTDRTLEAIIGGMEWPQGKTVTYKLSISPEYEFKLENENPVLDAHYDILLTKLIVSDVPAGKAWTVTAPTLNKEEVTIQKQDDMNSYAKQGYWTANYARGTTSGKLEIIGSARGETVYQGTGSGEFPIAVFVPENIGDASRTVELSVRLDDSDDIVQTLTISQLAPAWYGNGIGCERIESKQVPWGFYWDERFKIIYDLESCNRDDRISIRRYIEWTQGLHDASDWPLIGWLIRLIFGDDIPDLSFVDIEKSGIWPNKKADKITINLGSLSTEGIAESVINGAQNTREIYNFEGIQFVNEIINRIQNIPGYQVTTEGDGVFPTNNASIACMKLNSWDIIEANNEYVLSLTGGSEVMDPKWYLPAKDEISGISDKEFPLEDDHWTSTAVKDNNKKAYKYSADGTSSEELRNTELKVRAVRKKP
ncbi:fimbrillin family protein [Bacteroides uniformis]|uniref:fimbrillin family protein n=1 Tax=Bacteroides uniformis TaxID=820 RepID=UPI001E4B9E14|nr:fimbrillin family protein [Bacteroides uniformis]